jgi:two-component system nitrate/nitrite response regulator NarL
MGCLTRRSDVGDLRGLLPHGPCSCKRSANGNPSAPRGRPHHVQGGPGAILASREGLVVVGSTSTGEEAADQVAKTKPDVIVTQLDMQPKTAEEIIEGLRKASPDSRIVVLTLWDNLRYVQAVSRMAVDALMHKSVSAEELIDTIGAVCSAPGGGNAVISMPRGRLQRLDERPSVGLSERETEVLVLAARGLSNARIAQELHLSEATVKRHLANVYEKVGVNSRNEAVRMALVEQWIGFHEITSAADEDGSDGQTR